MAGTITVTAPCNNGMVQVAVSFSHSGGSFNGFNVLVDGNPTGAFQYSPTGMTTVSVDVLGDGFIHSI